MTPGRLTRLLNFLNSDRGKRRWGHWKGVRCLIAYTIWFVRYRGLHPPIPSPRSSHNAKDVR